MYRQKHSQHFKIKLLFFTINLPFVTLNQTPTYRKLNLPHMQYLFILLTSRNARATETNQSIRFYSVWKETTHKPLKVAAAKPFSPVYMLLVQLASMSIFILYDNWKTLLFIIVYRYSVIILTAMLLLSLKPVFWIYVITKAPKKPEYACWISGYPLN